MNYLMYQKFASLTCSITDLNSLRFTLKKYFVFTKRSSKQNNFASTFIVHPSDNSSLITYLIKKSYKMFLI